MIRRLIAHLGIIFGGLSFVILVGIYGFEFKTWLLGSYAPLILIASVFIYLKMGRLQSVILPFLLLYAFESVAGVPFESKYLFGWIYFFIMLAMAFYIVITRILKIKILSTLAAIVIGLMILIAFSYGSDMIVEDKEDIIKIRYMERTLFFK
ncbi:MAG: hypothetical protein ACQESB_03595 [Elusimicrobiota bacterium]